MSRNFKNLGFVLLVILSLTLSGCAESLYESDSSENPLKIDHQSKLDYVRTTIIIDEVTGVNYIVVSGITQGSGVTITPRLNKDGSLYITK